MKAFSAMLVMAGLLAASPALADAEYDRCIAGSDGTNAAWSDCGGKWIARADAALNAAWKELRAAVGEETASPLLDEQRAWNAFKEKSCLFWTSGEYGRDGQVLSYPACRAGVIEARTAELRSYLEQVEPQ